MSMYIKYYMYQTAIILHQYVDYFCRSSKKEIVEPILKATKIIYDYGPPELNLFKYLADEAHFLWEKENEKHKDDNEPMNGIVLVHDDDTKIAERCLHLLGFDLRSNELERGLIFYI